MSKLWYALFGIFIGAVSFISLSAHAQVSTNYWKFSSNYILPNVASWGLQIPSLSNLACIGTDSTGKFQSGTCGGGGGTISTSSPLVAGQGVYATGVNTIASVATSTPSLALGLSYSGTLGNFYSGTSGTLSIASSSLFTGTTGQNAYFNGTNSIIGTSTLFTSTASHIGIGTTSPASELSIQSVVTSGAQSEDLLTLANTASGGLWNFRIGNGTGFAAGYFNICQGQCTGTNYELQFQGFGVAQARGAFSAPAFDSNIVGRGSAPILKWTNGASLGDGTLDVGEQYVTGNIFLNNWIGGTGSWNIKRSDGSSLALATLLNSNNNFGIGTSTPGTFISAGSSTNAINLDVYATSTLTHGLNITSGCFSVAGTCITGGSSYTATYPITLTGSAFGLAFGTTTSNTWAGTQTFTNAPVVSAFGAGSLYSTSAGLIQTAATSSASSASTAVWRDANQNAFAQNFVSAATTFPSLGTTATLTAASPRTWVVTGTNTQTFKLPVGTTLTAGAQYNFNNNSTQPITIVDNGSNTLGVVPSGGSSFAQIYDVSTSNGTWDVHARLGHNIVSGDSTLGIGTTSPQARITIGMASTTDSLWIGTPGSTSPAFVVKSANSNGYIGVGTSTPTSPLSVIAGNASAPTITFGDTLTGIFRSALNAIGWAINGVEKMTLNSTGLGIGSTTPSTALSVGTPTSPGTILSAEYQPATSTSMTIDFKNGNQQLVRTGTNATAIGFSNAFPGTSLRVVVCNPNASAGAITWSGVEWAGGTAPTQTTTANQCDVWSFIVTGATSTAKIFGAQSAGFQ